MDTEGDAQLKEDLLNDIELYFDYLVIVFLHDTKQYEKVRSAPTLRRAYSQTLPGSQIK
jgi:hypothetical protein